MVEENNLVVVRQGRHQGLPHALAIAKAVAQQQWRLAVVHDTYLIAPHHLGTLDRLQ